MIKQAEQILGLFPGARTTEVFETAVDDFYADIQTKRFGDYKRICAYIEKCVKENCEYMPKIAELVKYRDNALDAIRSERQNDTREKEYPECKHCRNKGIIRYYRVYNEPKQRGRYECYPVQTLDKWRKKNPERVAVAFRQGKIYEHWRRCFCERGQAQSLHKDILDIFPEFVDHPEWNYYFDEDPDKKLTPEELEQCKREVMQFAKSLTGNGFRAMR